MIEVAMIEVGDYVRIQLDPDDKQYFKATPEEWLQITQITEKCYYGIWKDYKRNPLIMTIIDPWIHFQEDQILEIKSGPIFPKLLMVIFKLFNESVYPSPPENSRPNPKNET